MRSYEENTNYLTLYSISIMIKFSNREKTYTRRIKILAPTWNEDEYKWTNDKTMIWDFLHRTCQVSINSASAYFKDDNHEF